jgi:SAM-dependent methyltransferase
VTNVRAGTGRGHGPITKDGCAVELYAALPADGEAEIIHAALSAGASILDLGSGAGRIADPLVRLGHPVVAVDESAEMLAHVREAATLCSRIEGLNLGRCFDSVLLASNLINTPDTAVRTALLATAECHVDEQGRVIVQCHPADWLDHLAAGQEYSSSLGSVRAVLRVLAFDGAVLDAVVEYASAESQWEHRFRCQRLSEADLVAALAHAGLRFEQWLTADRSWLSARRGV